MKRILMVLTVALILVAMIAVTVPQAFAAPVVPPNPNRACNQFLGPDHKNTKCAVILPGPAG